MKTTFILLALITALASSYSNPCWDVTWRNFPGLVNPDSTMEDTCYYSPVAKKFYVKTIGIRFQMHYFPITSSSFSDNQQLFLTDFDSINHPITFNAIKRLINLPNYIQGSLINRTKLDTNSDQSGPYLIAKFSSYIAFDSVISALDTINNKNYFVISHFPNGGINMTSVENEIDNQFYQTDEHIVFDKYYTKIELFDLHGNLILKDEKASKKLDINFLQKGIYFLVLSNNEKRHIHKFVK